jgi:colanic acid biosynthesis glycosyl transferase WcaI
MAAGRPIIASVDEDSDTADAVRVGSCGVLVAPGRADLLANAVRSLADSPELKTMGGAARRTFEAVYAKDAAIGKLRAIIEQVAGERRT